MGMVDILSRNNILNSFRKWKVGSVVRGILVGSQEITDQVGEHIYPIVAPEGTEGDFIVYTRTKYTKKWTEMGVYEDECEIQVLAISDNYDRVTQLAENIDLLLTGPHTIDGRRFNIDLSNSSETFEDLKYIEALTFTIK